MALQFLVGAIVSVVNIMIHALVTVAAIGIARTAALRYTAWPRSQLMGVMVVTAAVLMVAHTLEVFVWALAYAIVGAAPAGSSRFIECPMPGTTTSRQSGIASAMARRSVGGIQPSHS